MLDERIDMETDNSKLNSLILLFVFDKMDVPLTESTILEMCCSRNNWINYMECKQAFNILLKNNFITMISSSKGPVTASGTPTIETAYALTVDGRMCLSHLFYYIPASLRAEIVDYVAENRMHYRRRQEYTRDYYMNEDGTHTVVLGIKDPTKQLLEIKMNVDSRATAKSICNKWDEKASQIYASLYELLDE
ncbi:MAG TPA: DUF4364 family protein [Clostridia bacterium]|jgi:hypothetical protein